MILFPLENEMHSVARKRQKMFPISPLEPALPFSYPGIRRWGQKMSGRDLKPLLTQTVHWHIGAHWCIRGPTLKLCVSPSLLLLWVRSSVCLPAPFPGHHRLCVLCSSSCCFWLNFRTWTGQPVWVALWTHLEVLANAQLTLCLKKCRILSKPPSLSMLSCFWLWNNNVLP